MDPNQNKPRAPQQPAQNGQQRPQQQRPRQQGRPPQPGAPPPQQNPQRQQPPGPPPQSPPQKGAPPQQQPQQRPQQKPGAPQQQQRPQAQQQQQQAPPQQQQQATRRRIINRPEDKKKGPIEKPPATHDNPREQLNLYLRYMYDCEGSDIHFKANSPAFIRVHGELQPVDAAVDLTPQTVEKMAFSIMNQRQRKEYEETNECDMSYSLPGVSRFRVNIFRQSGFTGAVFRTIPLKIQTIRELKLPLVLEKLANRPKGLILVTGPTGSGKSTTLAAMIDQINESRNEHILTIEDPIEFLHRDKNCSVCQREVGEDTISFARALRSALREDPDVILVGELRNLETISLAITAAETGHLVFATLHTTGAVQTINRIIDVFPPHQQQQIRMQLSVTLQSVISQTLVPLANGKGRIVGIEIMVINSAISSLIRENKIHMITQMIQGGKEQGMVTLDSSLAELYKKRLISYDHALAKCQAPNEFKKLIERG